MPESIEDLMTEIRGRVEQLESCLPSRVDAMVSPDSKLPFKALLYRAALIWRMAEQSRGAFENFEKDKLASALLLTRAAIEATAGLWYLHAKLEAAVKAGAAGDIDSYLMKLAMGSRADPAMPEALNVMKFVDHVEKDVEGFRHQYDIPTGPERHFSIPGRTRPTSGRTSARIFAASTAQRTSAPRISAWR